MQSPITAGALDMGGLGGGMALVLVRLLSHPRLHPSISLSLSLAPGGVVQEDRTQGSLEQKPLRIRRLSEDDSKFLHLTPLPRCTSLLPRCPLV